MRTSLRFAVVSLVLLLAGVPVFSAAPQIQLVDRDRYGDQLPPGARERLGTLRFRFEDRIQGTAFSQDGRRLAVIVGDRTVVIVAAASGKEERRINTQ
jgi:hypothetical protein